jgi:hypothetical protein
MDGCMDQGHVPSLHILSCHHWVLHLESKTAVQTDTNEKEIINSDSMKIRNSAATDPSISMIIYNKKKKDPK